ncbi:MAG TPA: sigma-70 family RNA polymerase sigma factor [Acidobacteriota bacterium]|nr:sigma-70 family RNA polymerase sigma factor [Acidobacteriota bacterium]
MGTYIASVAPMEANLMSRVRNREDGAFHELFHRFQDKIFRTAMRILKEEAAAQDALQETFFNIYRASRSFRGDSKIGTWVNRITVNVCLEMIRKNKKHAQRIDEDISENVFLEDRKIKNPYQKAVQNEARRRVHGALQRLGEKHRTVVDLHDLQGYTIREIASMIDVAEGTVKSRLFYGRQELKKQLTQ